MALVPVVAQPLMPYYAPAPVAYVTVSSETDEPSSSPTESSANGNRCVSCDRAKGKLRLRLRNCAHVICAECALECVGAAVDEDGVGSVYCPEEECPRHIHPNDLHSLLKSKCAPTSFDI